MNSNKIYSSIMTDAETTGIEPVLSNESKRVYKDKYQYGSDKSVADTIERVVNYYKEIS